MKNTEIPMLDLCDIQLKLDCGIQAALAIHGCMTDSPNDASGYTDPLFAACDYLRAQTERLGALIDGPDAGKEARA